MMRSIGTALRGGTLLLALAAPARAAPPKALAPIPGATLALMAARGTSPAAPILLRAYKRESEIEVWKRGGEGRYVHLKTFPICRWSGQLGPKTREGDRQTPEGFYPVAPRQMNPNSRYYLAFDVGYPNAFDRAHRYTGGDVMVHGTCSSRGCFAMTDRAVGELYALVREAFAGGQKAFQFQSYPFRMTAEAMVRHRTDPDIAFWRDLKEGSDRFEATGEEPVISVVEGRYAFAPSADPAREALAEARRRAEAARAAALLAEGPAAVRTTYADGDQHPTFAAMLRLGASLGDVSRPEALAFAGREVVVVPARPRPRAVAGMPAAGGREAVLAALGLPPGAAVAPSAATASEGEPSLFSRAPVAEGATRLTLALAPAGASDLPVFAAPMRFIAGR